MSEPVAYCDAEWLALIRMAGGSFQEARMSSIPDGSRNIPLYASSYAQGVADAARVCAEEKVRDDLTGDYRYGAGICEQRIRALKIPEE